ncbi:MAG: hypothetical protein NZ874_01050, partial [Fimbriimonadales bacterium]|nr:hypothetical protein [Fimbriimonadales bacterium]
PVAWASRPSRAWLRPSCPSAGTDTTVRATLHGLKARATQGRRRGRRRDGLDKTVQATLCLGETPKPRPSARRRRDAVTTS